MRADWDIFCAVIDNYGDIGVTWRLARNLARNTGSEVRLWVDDLTAFQHLWPTVDPRAQTQRCENVTVCAWRSPFPLVLPARTVIEAFGCTLPEPLVLAMAAQSPPPVWINLEYLSAEPWVASHHGLPSPHPRLPLTKYFYFPGYSEQTGGLLRERDLLARRQRFVATEIGAYWHALGLMPPHPGEWRVSLFAYENPALPALLDAWAANPDPVTLLVPEGRIVPQLAGWLGVHSLSAGAAAQRGALSVRILPFVPQDDYDQLLWACDLNCVRGEDSCVRAQWAARPLLWQAYPQAESAHFDKLEALLSVATPPPALATAWRRWNGVPDAPDMATCWAALQAHRTELNQHAVNWQQHLAQLPSLAEALVDFSENTLKSHVFSTP